MTRSLSTQILALLRENGREKDTDMARQLHVPLATVFLKHKKMDQKCIKKYAALIHFAKLGFFLRYFIYVRLKNKEDIAMPLFGHTSINAIFAVNNGFHFVLDTYFKDLNDFETFKEELNKNIMFSKIVPLMEAITEEEFLTAKKIRE